MKREIQKKHIGRAMLIAVVTVHNIILCTAISHDLKQSIIIALGLNCIGVFAYYASKWTLE